MKQYLFVRISSYNLVMLNKYEALYLKVQSTLFLMGKLYMSLSIVVKYRLVIINLNYYQYSKVKIEISIQICYL